ncbi:MAG: biotin--[Firmicutes bacterium]|nr:biotin--[acetyl-CoA-carboxylase] ligase [Bacillota bacterium]
MSVRESVLEALNQNKGSYLSGEKLSEELGVSRTAVWKAIKALREAGYRIDAVTNRGYCLCESKTLLSEEEIRRFLPAKYRNNGLYVYDVIDSTNNRARQIAVNEPEAQVHGSAVIALQQTAGKGRLGRSFFSPKEGIYLSIIVRPDFDLSKSVLVTVAAAAAVAEAIDATCGQKDPALIKWVNDVYLSGRKVCGILTEGITDFESGQIDHLVIGIGVNTNLEGFPEELLKVAGAVEGDYSRSELAAQIIGRVLKYLEDIDRKAFMETYRGKSLLIGRNVRVFKGVYRQSPEDDLTGASARVLGIDDDGGLQVIYTDGSRETLTTGEVTVRL